MAHQSLRRRNLECAEPILGSTELSAPAAPDLP